MRLEYMYEVKDQQDFAERAAKFFTENEKGYSYTDGEIEPGCLIALRWGMDGRSVAVVKIDHAHESVIYAELVNKIQNSIDDNNPF